MKTLLFVCAVFMALACVGICCVSDAQYKIGEKMDILIELQQQQLSKVNSIVVVDTVRVVKYQEMKL